MVQGFQLNMELRLIQVMMTKMLLTQFVSMMMVIQLKLMKVVCNKKNMMSQELSQILE
jgi:hypothetical protein